MFKHVVKASEIVSDTDLVKAVIKKAYSPIRIGDAKIDLNAEGLEIQLPRWAARRLFQLGLIEIKSIDEIGLRELLRMLWRESREINLTSIDPHFYPKIKRTLRKIREEIKENLQPETIQKLKRFENTVMDIINCRIQKIVQAALSEAIPQILMENMTIEEKALLGEIKQIIKKWKEYMLKGEEEK
ncbi:MAG: DNA replication complex GINS family protein [archaeon GB-1845-036]|nr:DNA replication complex GINS family protein [Candidatus Culexmicrobium thermophilum]HDO21028.1 DNA replication complex GINS family protein [Candidatus Bathyarchaeota archaeon]